MMKNTNVRYLYDGSLSGFYSCVFESVYSRKIPAEICAVSEYEPTLLEEIEVETNEEHALRVRNSIPEKCTKRAQELVENVFLSCLAEKERHLLTFLLRAYKEGPQLMRRLGEPCVDVLVKAEKHLLGEAHLLLGFVRFSQKNDVLVSEITPKNFILPYIASHFTKRYAKERFLIFDKTNKAALVYENRKAQIIFIDSIEEEEAGEDERRYRALWRCFYDTIAIEGRENPKCRMTHMPKRYWENMTEMVEFL